MTTHGVLVTSSSYDRASASGNSKPRPKQHPITSPDRPGLLVFQRATLKNWVRPGYKATLILLKILMYNTCIHGSTNTHYPDLGLFLGRSPCLRQQKFLCVSSCTVVSSDQITSSASLSYSHANSHRLVILTSLIS